MGDGLHVETEFYDQEHDKQTGMLQPESQEKDCQEVRLLERKTIPDTIYHFEKFKLCFS